MVRKEIEIDVFSGSKRPVSYDVEKFLNTDDFKLTKVLSERIMDMCSYISNISKTLVKKYKCNVQQYEIWKYYWYE